MVEFSPNSMLIFSAFWPGFSANAVRIGSNDANLRFKRFILKFCGPTKPIVADLLHVLRLKNRKWFALSFTCPWACIVVFH